MDKAKRAYAVSELIGKSAKVVFEDYDGVSVKLGIITSIDELFVTIYHPEYGVKTSIPLSRIIRIQVQEDEQK